MVKESYCSGKNLENLLTLLAESIFESLLYEPSIEETRCITKGMYPHATEKEVLEDYKKQLRRIVEDRRDTEDLFKYGETREEILNGLRKHVNGCEKCFSNYLSFIVDCVNKNFESAKNIILHSKDPVLLDYTKNLLNSKLIDILGEIDKQYLQLLSQ